MKRIETQRLLLRPFCQGDLEAFYGYAKNPNVGIHAGWKPHESMEESQQILNGFIEEKEVFALVYQETGQLIGSVGLHNDWLRQTIPGCKMLGYVLDEAFWGKGIMTEAVHAIITHAFEEEKLKFLSVHHFTQNMRSRRVIEKSGFRFEGTLRQTYFNFDGRVFDSCCYSMTRREYLLKKAGELGLSLQLPETFSEEAYWEYIKEWGDSRMTPFGISPREMTYAQWLENNIKIRTQAPDGFVCATDYFLTDAAGTMLGAVDIRHALNEFLLECGGHIGYGVRPTQRRNGYAEMMLALALEKCLELGIEKALVTCDDDNEGSAKTIEANGGVLENVTMYSGKPVRRYWIAVSEAPGS